MNDEPDDQHDFDCPDNWVGSHKMGPDSEGFAMVIVENQCIDRSMDDQKADQE